MPGEVEAADTRPTFVFTLFIAGEGSQHRAAVGALRRLCDRRFQGCYRLEVVDVFERPDLADDARILATPTLLKTSPGPAQKIIGDPADLDGFLEKLDVDDAR